MFQSRFNFRQNFTSRSLMVILFAVLALMLTRESLAVQDSFKVGDEVSFKYLGKTLKGKVVGFNPLNWPEVEFEYRNNTRKRPFRPADLKKPNGGSSSQTKPGGGSGNVSSGSGFASAELKTWTDATGKFKVEARLLSEKNGKVELQKEDGRVVTLPANKLSTDDQEYLKQIKLKNSEENPFAGGVVKDSSSSTTGAAPAASGSATTLMEPTTEPDPGSNEIVLTHADWNVTPDAAVPVEFSKRVISPSKSLSGNPFHSRLSNFVVSPNHQFAAGTSTNAFDKFTELITIDLSKGKANPNLAIPMKDCGILAISPSGTRAATFKKGRGADPGRLDFWQINNKNLVQTDSWKTAGFHDRAGFSPRRGVFLDDSRLLTFGRRVVLWDCETAAALYSFVASGANALSSNQKQLAVSAGKDTIWIVSVEDGNVLGTIESEGQNIGGIAFSQNGQFLAGYDSRSGAISIWDLSNGELIREMATPGGTASSIQWIGDKYLLMNQRYLMDVELRATVWRYQMNWGSILSSADTRFWFVSKEKLTPITLPHKNLDGLTAEFDPDDLLILKPGATVAIELDLPFRPDEQTKIRQHLTSQLEEIGVNIDNSADLLLRATVKRGKSQTTEMSSWTDPFGRRGTQKVSYTPNTSRVALIRGKKIIWEKATTHTVAGILSPKQGESIQQAASRVCQPQPAFFTSVVLPPYMAALPADKPPGMSTVSAAGIQ